VLHKLKYVQNNIFFHSLLIVLFYLGTMMKGKNLTYLLINHDSSFPML
jgi:hypothetical protein